VRLACVLAAACALWASDVPGVFYSKSFPASIPAYVAIRVDKNGNAEFTDSPDGGEPPVRFQLEASETAAIFSLAEKLDYFSRPLEAGLKVAFTGEKTLRYQDGTRRQEVKFNYSQEQDALLLVNWFERISTTAQHRINLEKAARFDRLGVDAALIQLQLSVERNDIAGARQLLHVLDRIAKNGSFFNRARERAASLAEAIRAAQAETD